MRSSICSPSSSSARATTHGDDDHGHGHHGHGHHEHGHWARKSGGSKSKTISFRLGKLKSHVDAGAYEFTIKINRGRCQRLRSELARAGDAGGTLVLTIKQKTDDGDRVDRDEAHRDHQLRHDGRHLGRPTMLVMMHFGGETDLVDGGASRGRRWAASGLLLLALLLALAVSPSSASAVTKTFVGPGPTGTTQLTGRRSACPPRPTTRW